MKFCMYDSWDGENNGVGLVVISNAFPKWIIIFLWIRTIWQFLGDYRILLYLESNDSHTCQKCPPLGEVKIVFGHRWSLKTGGLWCRYNRKFKYALKASSKVNHLTQKTNNATPKGGHLANRLCCNYSDTGRACAHHQNFFLSKNK